MQLKTRKIVANLFLMRYENQYLYERSNKVMEGLMEGFEHQMSQETVVVELINEVQGLNRMRIRYSEV